MARRADSAFDARVADAVAHHKAGRLAEAEAAYLAALALAPDRPSVLHNLGVVAAGRGDQRAALDRFDRVIAAEPGYASAHYNRAVALNALGMAREAIAAFERAAVLEPGHYGAHRALGLLWLAQGERGRALDHFARTCELRRGEDRDGSALASLTHATRGKLAHDAAQLRHIASRRRDGKRFELLARAYDEVLRDFPDGIRALTRAQLEVLGEHYNTAIHVAGAPEVPQGAVSSAIDAEGVSRALGPGGGGATSVDGLLAPAALVGLRRFLLESTIWHDFSHIGGFVATYLEDGLACPLVLQIADELRQALPGLLGPHPLTQAWAYKGLEGSSSVAAHADDAAVSVNLWLTPDAANLEPGGGGLAICLAPPPPDWQIRGYEADMAEIAAFMARERAGGRMLDVPYGENRAAVFDARLFHSSDAPRFAAGYESHRINLTLLYGRGGG